MSAVHPLQPAGLPAVLVEAFAAAPLQGNGAAVVLLDRPAEATWMQALAASFRQSETAFLWQRSERDWCLRWFTPSCEVPLCGHATLAAALALGHWQRLRSGAELCLASRSGPLRVCLQQAGSASLVLPAGGLEPLPTPAALETLLGAPVLRYWGSALGYRVALLPERVALADLPSPAAALRGPERQGLVLMQRAPGAAAGGGGGLNVLGQAPDYHLRFFAPGLGIEEDPVTGSAHALVAPWWMEQLGRPTVCGWQCSARRGGMLCEQAMAGQVRLSGTGHLLWDGLITAGPSGSDATGWQVCRAG
ncbi:MAG: PhzF family phenazine biosynthesis protein [Vulcanococcus sp.]